MAKQVKLYGWAFSPFVSRALLCLEEAGVEYELIPMSRKAGDHRRPEHLARNPFGQVPVLEDGDLTLFESRAIGRHVLRKHKPELLGEGNLEQAAMVDVWLEVEAHQHHPVAFAIVVECVFAPLLGRARNQAAVDENVAKLKKVLEVYEARLSQSKYLAGDSISLADLSHFTVMHYFMATEYAAVVEALPHVKAWWEELAARPAARKVAAFMPLGFGPSMEEQQ
ncbi:glutathione S-transferase 4-like [Phragmites australis]|uniref:glutathione S-transferase 4-like n=1 Tax=Phragmites australis TaxID=29695 RepID=UPI002D7794DA|nr:glutathione S-transferase 4-like [Phragmites australis]